MRSAALLFALGVVALTSGACTPEEARSAPLPKGTAAATKLADDVKADARGAGDATREYTYNRKSEFVREMRQDLARIDAELDRLAAKVDKSGGAAKADAAAKLKVVRGKWVQAKRELDQADGASESKWDEVRESFRKSYRELKESFDSSRQWLSDKLAP